MTFNHISAQTVQTTGKQSSRYSSRMYPTLTTAMWASLMMACKSFLRTLLSNWRSHQKLLQYVFSRGHLPLQLSKLLTMVSRKHRCINAIPHCSTTLIYPCHFFEPCLILAILILILNHYHLHFWVWSMREWPCRHCYPHNLMYVCFTFNL